MVDDGFAVFAREVDFDLETEAFFGDEDGGEVSFFFEDAESAVIFVFVKFGAFGEAFVVQSVMKLARRAEIGNEDGDGAQNDESEKSPAFKPNCESGESGGDNRETNVPPSVAASNNIFFSVPRDRS